MFQVYDCLRRKDAIPHPTRPGYFTSPHPTGEHGEVLCVEADRSIGSRPKGTTGAWETWRDDGTKAVFEDTFGGPTAILLVD